MRILLILITAFLLTPSPATSQTSGLSVEDFNKLREAAVGTGTGKPLHSKVVAVFGLGEKGPILVSEILSRGVGLNNMSLESSIWFSSTSDDAFVMEHVGDTVTIYHTDASRVLRAAAAGQGGLDELKLIPNEQAADGFTAILGLWAKVAQRVRVRSTQQ